MSDAIVITIPGQLTTRNEHERSARGNKYAAAELKRAETQRVAIAAHGCPAVRHYPVRVTCIWYRRDRRSDPDNIAGGIKYVLDGLQAAGVLRNDGWTEIASIAHEWRVDKRNPRVEVILEVSA